MVKKMFYLLLLLSLLFGYHFAFAQDIPTSYRFEVGIPGIVGKNQSLGIVGLPDLILKSVTMLYVVGAIIAFISLIVAGFQYITSQGNASKTKDAMDRVQKAFIGLLILLGAYAILYTINPDLVKIPQNLFMPSKTLDSNWTYDISQKESVDKIISILDGGTLNITLDGDVVQDLKDGKIDPALFGVIDSIFVWAENKPTTCGRIELGPFISGHLNVSYPTCHRSGQAFDVVVLGVDGTETQQKTCQNELMNDLKAFSNITIIHEDAKNGQLAHLHIQTVNCLAK